MDVIVICIAFIVSMGAFFCSLLGKGSGFLKEEETIMLLEVYYEHYYENCRSRYWEMEEKSIPYMVVIRDYEIREEFYQFLESEGFRCVAWNKDYPGVLVNTELKRFGLINRSCKHLRVDDRSYSLDEFMEEVYKKLNKD